MRDFRDAKAMAQTLRAALAAKGHKVTIGESLELIAKALGAADWNTLSAAIKSAETDKSAESSTAPVTADDALDRLAVALGWHDWVSLMAVLQRVRPGEPPAVGRADRVERTPPGRRIPVEPPARERVSFSPELTKTLHRAVALAVERKHTYTTLEHLLLALIDDPDASAVMEACEADLAALRARATSHVDDELKSQVGETEPVPTAGFHRVVQRSVIHVQSSGRGLATGANILVAIFSERESHACYFLQQQKMNRYDAVNFIAHGIRKGGAAA